MAKVEARTKFAIVPIARRTESPHVLRNAGLKTAFARKTESGHADLAGSLEQLHPPMTACLGDDVRLGLLGTRVVTRPDVRQSETTGLTVRRSGPITVRSIPNCGRPRVDDFRCDRRLRMSHRNFGGRFLHATGRDERLI